jgi:hypothetical protein
MEPQRSGGLEVLWVRRSGGYGGMEARSGALEGM